MTDETTHYETLFIVHPVHSGRNKDLCDRFRGVLEGQGATVTHFEEWGLRDLAYPIEKQNRGLYNLVQYQALAGTSDELERVMRLSDEVIRCMTVVLDEDVLPLARAEAPAPAVETAQAAEPTPAAEPEPAAAAVESAPTEPAAAAVESAPTEPAAAAVESAPTEPAAVESAPTEPEPAVAAVESAPAPDAPEESTPPEPTPAPTEAAEGVQEESKG